MRNVREFSNALSKLIFEQLYGYAEFDDDDDGDENGDDMNEVDDDDENGGEIGGEGSDAGGDVVVEPAWLLPVSFSFSSSFPFISISFS